MKKNKFLFVLCMLVSISVVLLCSTFFYVKLNKKGTGDDSYLVMTSCNPVYLATVNVVGRVEGVTVQNLSQPTTGCLHDYTLTTEDMKNLSSADVLVVNGGGMEGYLDDVMEAYPNLAIIDTFEAVEHSYPVIIEDEEEEEEENLSHGVESEEHHHDTGTNSHIWMSEEIYAGQVQAIADGLGALDSNNAASFTANADAFIDVMDSQLDNQGLDELLAGENVAVLHEAFAYTAQSLGLDVVATMDLDEERQVSAGEVSEFIESINDNNVRIVLAEYDYGHAMGELITEQTDAKVVYLETLVHGDYSGLDYITVLNKNYALIRSAL